MRRALPSLLLALAAGCAPATAPELVLLRFRQGGQENVLLNEALDFHFSTELDPASVTDESFAVLDPDGSRVRGHVEVHGAKLLFLPDLPLRADLTDGGLVPGTTYHAVLVGFPRPDGLRGRHGELLELGSRLWFRTGEARADARPFLDPQPDRMTVFVDVPLSSRRIGPLDPILLECDEAIDPSTVAPEQFQLFREDEGPRLTPIPVSLSLVENHPDHALLEMRPRGESPEVVPALEPGTYALFDDPKRSDLSTLGGRPVRLAIRGGLPQLPHLEIRVVGPHVVSLREEFRDVLRRSPQEVSGVDGTALWDGTGSIRLRFPAAAGDGSDGETTLDAPLASHDVHATGLVVPEGAVCELPPEGLVVLRAQGALEVRGRLVRRVEGSALGRGADEDFADWADRARRGSPDAWEVPSMTSDFLTPAGTTPLEQDRATLSAWLAEVARRNPSWTVLVAGGDLRVTGTIDCDGPVLLVAGGWVRVHGRLEVREAWKLREGGGSGGVFPRLRTAPLILDEPTENPLAAPLRVAALSSSIRPPSGLVGWRAAQPEVHAGGGTASVQFYGESGPGDAPGSGVPAAFPPAGRDATRLFGPVENLALLEGCGAVRFLVTLELRPGEPWDPPRVESIELSWFESP